MRTPAEPATAAGQETPTPGAGRFVLLGGVPGAGKTTLLRKVRSDHPQVRAVDPETLRDRVKALLPDTVPYRCYRALVHTLTAVHTVVLLLRGPSGLGRPLVVHDPATRPRRRSLTGRLARLRGWDPVLVLVDVTREAALAGQRSRGRLVPPGSFSRHWRRWQQQRPHLRDAAGRPSDRRPWSQVHVVDRDAAALVLPALLG